jgi:hypothetical protein
MISYLRIKSYNVLNYNNYNQRNSSQYRVPRCSLETFSNRFFPSTIRLWNSLEPSFKIEIRVACRRLLYSVIWTDHESYRRTTTLVKSMITVVSLRELHIGYQDVV